MMPETGATDPRELVARGYDRIGPRYARHALVSRTEERERYLQALFDLVPQGSTVLDLGCGNGIPMTVRLAERFAVTGVDISERQVRRARRNAPSAVFICSDIATLQMAPASFDAVFASYSLIHVPRHFQPGLLRSIREWLKPGGILVATMPVHGTEADYSQNWLGAPMYWSGFDTEENRRIVAAAGFQILSAKEETAEEAEAGWGRVTFLWIVAETPEDSRDATGTATGQAGGHPGAWVACGRAMPSG